MGMSPRLLETGSFGQPVLTVDEDQDRPLAGDSR